MLNRPRTTSLCSGYSECPNCVPTAGWEDTTTLVGRGGNLLRYDSGASAVFITSTGEFPGTNRQTGLGGWCLRRAAEVVAAEVPEREFCFASDQV